MAENIRYEEDRIQCSTDMSAERWTELMGGSRACEDYEELKGFVKTNCPNLYATLALDFPNPYASGCGETETHFILAHSMKQYFIAK